MSEAIVDLGMYRLQGSKIFTGRDRGRNVKLASKLDEKIEKNEIVNIIIPSDIYSINPSFLEEFLFDAVTRLGKSEFQRRVIFKNDGAYDIQQDLDEAIDRILRDKNTIL